MADNNFRPYRSRDPLPPRGADAPARAQSDDPLAELARLIGQSDTGTDYGRDADYGAAPAPDEPAAGGLDWAADDRYAEPNEPAGRRLRCALRPALRAGAVRTLLHCVVPRLRNMTAATKRHPPVNFPSPRRGSMGRAKAPEAMRRRRRRPHAIATSSNRRSRLAVRYRPFCRGCATSVTTTTTSRRTMPTTRLTRRTTTRMKRPMDAAGAVLSSSRRCWAWPCWARRAPSPIAPCSAVRCCRHCRRSSKPMMVRTRSCRWPIMPARRISRAPVARIRARRSSRARSSRSICRRR